MTPYPINETILEVRHRALVLAIQQNAPDVIAAAKAYEFYMLGDVVATEPEAPAFIAGTDAAALAEEMPGWIHR